MPVSSIPLVLDKATPFDTLDSLLQVGGETSEKKNAEKTNT